MVTTLDKSILCPIIVGREPHLDALDRLIEQAHAGGVSPRTVLISGEAGIGKSRLVTEVKARASQRGFRILQGNCFEPDRALPYALLLDLLRAFCTARSAEDVARELGSAAPELVKLLPELHALLPDLAPTPPLEPEQEKRRLFNALLQFLSHLAIAQPLLVIVEDLHWSDDSSLEFLLYLVRRIASQPILLVLTYRSEEVHSELRRFLASLDRERLATELALARLTADEVEAMLRASFDLPRAVRADFLDTIYTLTEGNPFFIEEVLKSLVQSGDIFYTDSGWDRKPVSELSIPRTVQIAMQRRTDGLSADARRLLALAAVAGRRFDFAVLAQLTQHDERELLQLIKELIAAQLVVEESAETFAFRHALTCQSVYADLLARERRTLHCSIAEAIERVSAGSLETRLADLAYHFYAAGIWERALEYSQRAGERAQSLYAPRAAVEHFRRAIESARQLSQAVSLRLYRARGQAHETLGDFESAHSDHEAALQAARAANDPHAEWQSLLDLGMLWASRDYAQTGDYFQRALALARAMHDKATLAAPSTAWATGAPTMNSRSKRNSITTRPSAFLKP